MSRPQFVLLAGPNGAGKTTFTKTVKRKFPNIRIIDPDAIAKGMTGSFSTVDQKQMAAGKKAIRYVQDYIKTGTSFIAESTISGSIYLRYGQRAKDAGFRTAMVYVALSSSEMSGERVKARVSIGGHDIPTADVERRYPKSMANISKQIKIYENVYVYTNLDDYQWVAT